MMQKIDSGEVKENIRQNGRLSPPQQLKTPQMLGEDWQQLLGNRAVGRLAVQRKDHGMLQRSEFSREGMEESGDAAAPLGDALCEIMPDSWVVASVRTYFGVRYPIAKKYLDYYLSGKGGEYPVNVYKMFKENPTISKKIGKAIKDDGSQSGRFYGVGENPLELESLPPIRQMDYDSEDWRLALGNIDEVKFEILGEPDDQGNTLVKIDIRDPYEWHPEEDRGTQCIHNAMEMQKKNGAANFFAVGSAKIKLKLDNLTISGEQQKYKL